MEDPRFISIDRFSYELPDNQIARYPLVDRNASKLLIWKSGDVSDSTFARLPDHLPGDSVLVLNESRVVNARMFFTTGDGHSIEVFCLEAVEEPSSALQERGSVDWRCLVGGLKKWKDKVLKAYSGAISLAAEIQEKRREDVTVRFSWEPAQLSFAEVLEAFGKMPIPPYLKREAEQSDLERYQTVYAREQGSVAAPTAGLHFTPEMLAKLRAAGFQQIHIGLHVGGGTFKPVKAEKLNDHAMHAEWVSVRFGELKRLRDLLSRKIIAVGTTSLRAIESLYWMGQDNLDNETDLYLGQWTAYDRTELRTCTESFDNLLRFMTMHKLEVLKFRTSLLIAPPYKLRVAGGLITNFHQPGSTLLLIVAAIAGDDWRKIYDHALRQDYRFLSYGDSSLMLP